MTLEIADATLGGLAFGVGMTTYSHKVRNYNCVKRKKILTGRNIYQVGLYQEAVVSYEVVLADGSVVTATRHNEYSDLFHCLPWSHGTLGRISKGWFSILSIKCTRIKSLSQTVFYN